YRRSGFFWSSGPLRKTKNLKIPILQERRNTLMKSTPELHVPLKQILELPDLKVLAEGNPERKLSKVFCCDLLSIAMGKAPADGVWVTVMGNKNTLAVASLT